MGLILEFLFGKPRIGLSTCSNGVKFLRSEPTGFYRIRFDVCREAQILGPKGDALIDRRTALILGGTAMIGGAAHSQNGIRAGSSSGSESFFESRGFIGPDAQVEINPSGLVSKGSEASRHGEVAKAFRILFDAPRNTAPFEVAEYFRDLTQKTPAPESLPYNQEWDERANPVITGFFSMTNTLPNDGDFTPWCAAFVNFCLYTSGYAATFSALSGSFRSYSASPIELKDAQQGDIVVFKKRGADGDRGFGHVGFLDRYTLTPLNEDRDRLFLLGGNQRGNTGSTGAVTTTSLPRVGSYYELHSIHRPEKLSA